MQTQAATYQVFSASAGSGKTFTLVKEYLKNILGSANTKHFTKVLAITFTNKAAAEMKERIVKNLKAFAAGETNDMLTAIETETGIENTVLRTRAKKALESILQDYTSFHITTIDSFTHRIIRAFAFDFGLSLNFELDTDNNKVLQEAVDQVVDKIGVHPELTKSLINFAIQRSDEDKAWDISKQLFEYAKILLNEPDKLAFKNIADQEPKAYTKLHQKLTAQIKQAETELIEIGAQALELIEKNNLEAGDFYRSMLPNHFKNLHKDPSKTKFFNQSKLKERLEEGTFYALSKPANIKVRIEALLPELLDLYKRSEVLYQKRTLHLFFVNSLIPLSIISSVYQAMEKIKTERNILLISDFNHLIYEKVKEESAPYIYERLGEKYRHYFIDEMQDTSVLQWHNLIKLIDNALSQEKGSLLLVGDFKQSIYRWRGGEPDQFLHLADEDNNEPFKIPKHIENLPNNFRSFKEVVTFNNDFFSFISQFFIQPLYQKEYQKGANQKAVKESPGFVQIEFVDTKAILETEILDKEEIFPDKVYETIKNIESSFDYGELCVLVRKNSQGIAVAEYLTQKGIPVISSESLLLAQNEKVRFLIDLFTLLRFPDDGLRRFSLLNFLHKHLQVSETKHDFIQRLVKLETSDFYAALEEWGIDFKPEIFYAMGLYDATEYCIRNFKFQKNINMYVSYFLDFVFAFQQKNSGELDAFLEYWEQKKETESINTTEGVDAVRIMTIHKAKGLEFPVVIAPYDLDIYYDKNPKLWYPIQDPENLEGFNLLFIAYRKELPLTGALGEALDLQQKSLKELDNYNLLYVTYTRAVEALFIITEDKVRHNPKPNYTSGLLKSFLQANNLYVENQQVYAFGQINQSRKSSLQPTGTAHLKAEKFISNSLIDRKLHVKTDAYIYGDKDRDSAIQYGNLIHALLAKIYTKADVPMVIQNFVNLGELNQKEAAFLKEKIHLLIQHPALKNYYMEGLEVYNERELIDQYQHIHIPDRLVMTSQEEVVIIDYKTGQVLPKHRTQVEQYAGLLSEIGYRVSKKLLVYIDENWGIDLIEC